MIAVAAVAVGLTLGVLSGGRMSSLLRLRIRFEPFVLILFVLQGLARGQLGASGYAAFAVPVWALSGIALSGLLLVQSQVGLRLAAVGTLLNLLVVMVNGGMPADASLPGVGAAIGLSGGFYQPVAAGTVLPFLGDVLPVHTWMLASSGDVLLLAGVTAFVATAMRNDEGDLRGLSGTD